MALEVKTPPAEEPLTLSETKAYLKTSDASEDVWITSAIQAIRERCEAFTHRTLMTQTWVWWLDRFPTLREGNTYPGFYNGSIASVDCPVKELNLPKPPLQSITHLKTYDLNDVATPFSASRYLVDTASEPGRLILRGAEAWPSALRVARSVEVEFVAGYGDASDVPEALRQGMFLWVRLLYANKTWLFDAGAPVPGIAEFNREEIPLPVQALWDPFRMTRLS